MAAALVLTRPDLLAGAILFRPLSSFTDDPPSRLDGAPVLIIDGEKHSHQLPGDGVRLAERLIRAGATVTHHVLPVGHSITSLDREIARDWLAQTL
jgi:phospholipase/carboxylesterase